MATIARRIAHAKALARLHARRWRRRALFLAGGVAVGLAAVATALLADGATHAFRLLREFSPVAAFLATPAGFALCAWMALTVFPNAQGSGIPQVIAARQLRSRSAREKLVSLRVGVGKIALLTIGLLSGASTGREGPTVQIGASIMFAAGRLSPQHQPGLLLAGGAAGVAAAFNTPLAGVVFGIEELSRSFETRASGLVIVTVLTAGAIAIAFFGNYTYFGSTPATLPLGRTWLVAPLAGVAGGLLGAAFNVAATRMSRGLPGPAGRAIKAHPVVFAALCGVGVAICGYMTNGATDGTGYEPARAIVHSDADGATPYFTLWKFASTLLSTLSGIPGGLFSPSLSIGAGLGAALSQAFQTVPLGALALLGMASYMTGVLQAPITAVVIVSELTQDHKMILPLMVAAIVAQATSRLITKEGLYHALARNFIRAAHGAERDAPAPKQT